MKKTFLPEKSPLTFSHTKKLQSYNLLKLQLNNRAKHDTSFFLQGKKLLKLRKLHHDKTVKYGFLTHFFFFENGTLGHKIRKCYGLWHHFQNRAKK